MDFCTDVEIAVAYNPLWLLNNKILLPGQISKYLSCLRNREINLYLRFIFQKK